MIRKFKSFPRVKETLKTGKFSTESEVAERKPPVVVLSPCPCCGGPQESPEGLAVKGTEFVRCTVCRRVSILGCHPSDYTHEDDPRLADRLRRLVEFCRTYDHMRRAATGKQADSGGHGGFWLSWPRAPR
jgi:hypothetical protein